MPEKAQHNRQTCLQRLVGGIFLIALAPLAIPLLFKPSSNLPSPLIEKDEEEYSEPVSIISNAPDHPGIELQSRPENGANLPKRDVVDESTLDT